MSTVLAFLLTLGVLVIVHEYGHYRVAVACGVKVLRFSVGFGRVIWRRQATPDSTEFTLSMLPLGGYVRFLDEREGPVPPGERDQAFNNRPLRQRVAIVAAGPMANLLMAFLWALIAKLGLVLIPIMPWAGVPLLKMGQAGIFLNSIIMVLNLLPLPPLDGGRVIVGLLPNHLANRVASIEPYGMFILIGLMITGLLWHVLGPPITLLEKLLIMLVGI